MRLNREKWKMSGLKRLGAVAPVHARDVRNSVWGLGFEKLDRNVFDPGKAYDKVAALGVKWIRIQSGWARTERSEGVYDFAWLDSIVDNLVSRGLVPWICLCYGNGIYDEAAAPPERKRTEAKTNSAIEIYREIIKDNIDYDILIQDPKMDKDRLDEIVEIMLETVCTARKTIRIAGDDYPAELVKSKFMKLNSSHVEFVLDCMRENTTKIRNIKQYLKAVLFNAPSTIDSYYTALVNHDFYGSK